MDFTYRCYKSGSRCSAIMVDPLGVTLRSTALLKLTKNAAIYLKDIKDAPDERRKFIEPSRNARFSGRVYQRLRSYWSLVSSRSGSGVQRWPFRSVLGRFARAQKSVLAAGEISSVETGYRHVSVSPCVRALSEHKDCDVNSIDDSGHNPLFHALHRDAHEAVKKSFWTLEKSMLSPSISRNTYMQPRIRAILEHYCERCGLVLGLIITPWMFKSYCPITWDDCRTTKRSLAAEPEFLMDQWLSRNSESDRESD